MTQFMAEDYNPDLIDCLNADDPAGCMACEQSLAAFTSTYGIELTEAEEDAILWKMIICLGESS